MHIVTQASSTCFFSSSKRASNKSKCNLPDLTIVTIFSFLQAQEMFNFEKCCKFPFSSTSLTHVWKLYKKADYFMANWSDSVHNVQLNLEKTNYSLGKILAWYLTAKKTAVSAEQKIRLASIISCHMNEISHLSHFNYFMQQEMVSLSSSTPLIDNKRKISLLETALQRNYGGDTLLQGLIEFNTCSSFFGLQYLNWSVQLKATLASLIVNNLYDLHYCCKEKKDIIIDMAACSQAYEDPRAAHWIHKTYGLKIENFTIIQSKKTATTYTEMHSKKRKREKPQCNLSPSFPINLSVGRITTQIGQKILNFLSEKDLLNFQNASKNHIAPFTLSLFELRWKELRTQHFYHADWHDAIAYPSKIHKINYWLHAALVWYLTTRLEKFDKTKLKLAEKIAKYFMPLKQFPRFHYYMTQQMFEYGASVQYGRDSMEQMSLFEMTDDIQYGGDIFLQAMIEEHGKFKFFVEYIKKAIREKMTWASTYILALSKSGKRYIPQDVLMEIALESAKMEDYRALEELINDMSLEDFSKFITAKTCNLPPTIYRSHKNKKYSLIKKYHLLRLSIRGYSKRLSSIHPDTPMYVLKAAKQLKKQLDLENQKQKINDSKYESA